MSLSRRRFLVAGAAAVGSAAALVGACAPTAPPASATPGAPPTSPPIAAPTIAPSLAPTSPPTVAPTVAPTASPVLKIGVLVPYTESSVGVDIGLNQKRAADLYVKQHGARLGGLPVSLVYSAESVEAGINKVKVNTLLNTEKVQLLLGGASGETAYVLRDAAEAAKLVYIDTNATANALTRSIADCKPSCKSQYVFRTSASSWQLSEPLGEWASRKGVLEVFVAHVDDELGAESADAFEAGLSKHGGTPSGRSAFPNGGDWTQAVETIRAQPTTSVFAAFETDDAEGFLDAWSKRGMPQAGYTLYGPGFLVEQPVLEQVKSAAEGVITAHFWSPELDNAENKALVGAFGREHIDDDTGVPVALSGYAVAMWDAMAALDAALKQAGGATNVSALIAALEGVSFKSPRGAFLIDKATHNPVQDIVIRQTKSANGNLVNAVLDTLSGVADPG